MLSDVLKSDVSGCFVPVVWITQPGGESPMFVRGRPDWPGYISELTL